MSVEYRLRELGLTLPEAPAPVANYVPSVLTGALLHISGQISRGSAGLVTGVAGRDVGVEAAAECARLCALNLIAQVKAAIGDLDQVKRVVKLNVFVNSAPDFHEQPLVANGASDLMVAAFGPDVGRHARSAVGVAALPLNCVVEIDGVFEVLAR